VFNEMKKTIISGFDRLLKDSGIRSSHLTKEKGIENLTNLSTRPRHTAGG